MTLSLCIGSVSICQTKDRASTIVKGGQAGGLGHLLQYMRVYTVQCREPKTGQQKVQFYCKDDLTILLLFIFMLDPLQGSNSIHRFVLRFNHLVVVSRFDAYFQPRFDLRYDPSILHLTKAILQNSHRFKNDRMEKYGSFFVFISK